MAVGHSWQTVCGDGIFKANGESDDGNRSADDYKRPADTISLTLRLSKAEEFAYNKRIEEESADMDARHLCTVVLARDYRRLVDWYRKALRMKPKLVVTDGFDWTELARPGLRIGFAPAKQMGVKLPRKRSNAVILHLISKDVRALLRDVKKCGARIAFGPSLNKEDGYWYGAFEDLEGNPIWVIDLEPKP